LTSLFHVSTKGMALALLGFSLLSFGDALIKYLSPFYSTHSLVLYNSIFGLLTILLFSPWLGGLKATLLDRRKGLHLLRGGLVFVQLSLIVYAFSELPLATAYAMAFVAPLFSTLLAIPLLKDHVGSKQMMAIILGFVGVLVILRPGVIPLEWAALAALASAFFFSLVNITARHMRNSQHTLMSWGFYPHLVIISILILFFFDDLELVRAEDLGLMAALGAVSVAGAITLARSFAFVSTATAASFHYVQMLWGVLFGFVLFGDVIELWTGLGAAIVIVSGLWLIRIEKAKPVG